MLSKSTVHSNPVPKCTCKAEPDILQSVASSSSVRGLLAAVESVVVSWTALGHSDSEVRQKPVAIPRTAVFVKWGASAFVILSTCNILWARHASSSIPWLWRNWHRKSYSTLRVQSGKLPKAKSNDKDLRLWALFKKAVKNDDESSKMFGIHVVAWFTQFTPPVID